MISSNTTTSGDRSRDRIIVFIDASSLFYGAAALQIEVDYAKLLPCLVGDRILMFAYYYTGINPGNRKQQAFLKWIKNNGYRVFSKEITLQSDGHRKADLTVEIAVDMMLMSTHCDRILLVSGNGNLSYAIETISSRGTPVEIISLRSMTSESLITLANPYRNLDSLKDHIAKD
jgi:uncharacterized LabA/DUF88 family protein